MPRQFAQKLLAWYTDNTRKLPWKEDRDPYKIWISEIILQQTRVEQGTPYYLRFIATFPSIQKLASAAEDHVLKMWEGLGYYSRARNLHHTAKHICNDLHGRFPDQYIDILALKGIGPYTAAAIASFAYGLSYPVVDGNVLRLVSRYFGIEESIDKPSTKKKILKLMQQAIVDTDPAIFNQAIMDKGALICTPKKTNCTECRLSDSCYALAHNKLDVLPIRTKKIKKTKRYIYYYYIVDNNSVYIRKRELKGIWQGLYDFPSVEVDKLQFDNVIPVSDFALDKGSLVTSKVYKHLLSHQTLYIKFIYATGQVTDPSFRLVKLDQLDNYAFPRVLNTYMQDIGNSL